MTHNHISIIGRITHDIELRRTSNNDAVCNFSIAANHKHKNKSGEVTEETTYIDVTLWGRQAENLERYCSRGSQILVEGRIANETWNDKVTGDKRSKTKILARAVQFISTKDQNPKPEAPAPQNVEHDDIPF